MAEMEFDVAILGAGPVGCALALGLQHSGLSVALVDRPRANAPIRAAPVAVRAIALSFASRLILERFGAWDRLATTPIDRIHVSQAARFGRTWISREDMELPALGYVAAYDEIAPHLAGCLIAGEVRQFQAAAVPSARLRVHAEGTSGEQAIEREYGQSAIVATVSSERPAHGIAWERFTNEGPLALLPLGKDYALVWSLAGATAAKMMGVSDKSFLQNLQAQFGMRAGRFTAVGARGVAPLALRYRDSRVSPGEAYIGNAAQTLHPVAGQGLNLGLRDVWDLVELVRSTPREELGFASFAERFAGMRRSDARMTIRATNLLATLYVRRDPFSAALRSAALTAFDIFPHARRTLARSMIYGA